MDEDPKMTRLRKTVDMSYRPRIVDARIRRLLLGLGGILITGPKWCGKSWTGIHHSSSSLMLGERDVNNFAELSPENALSGKIPRLIDEWQDVPMLWDVARRNIDMTNKSGMYIFTGSSTPRKNSTYHTGTGRFARIEMKTMSLFESGGSNGSVSLSNLFENAKIAPIPSKADYIDTVGHICRGGWPAALEKNEDIAIDISKEYIKSIISTEMSDVTGIKNDPAVTERILRSLARNIASTVKMSTIVSDVSEDGRDITEQTARRYVDSLKSIFIVEEQNAWDPSLRSRARIRTSPKLHFTDPSLAVPLLDASPDILAKDVRTSGFLFESLCYRDLSIYASSFGGRIYHYRDSNDLEIDNIIEMPDGRWGALEVKLGDFEFDKAAANLLKLKERIKREPSFLGIITAKGYLAYTRDDGISVIPIDCLGP